MSPDPRNVSKRLGAAVRDLRKRAGWSQITLAEKADLAYNYVGEIERGEVNATVLTTVRLSRAFGMTGADLLKRAGV